MKYKKIIFICRDNSTLSPLAEAIFKSICNEEEVIIESRGLVVLFEAPINPKIGVVLGSHGIEYSKERTKGLSEADFTRDTLVLAMNERSAKLCDERFPMIQVATLYDFVGEKEVEDPYGGNLIDYEKCFSEMSVVLRKLSERLGEE